MESAKHRGAKAQEGEHSFRILEAHEFYRLEALYCALDAAARRRRFCAGVGDASIRSHCDSLSSKGVRQRHSLTVHPRYKTAQIPLVNP